jgi:hypothetical protein
VAFGSLKRQLFSENSKEGGLNSISNSNAFSPQDPLPASVSPSPCHLGRQAHALVPNVKTPLARGSSVDLHLANRSTQSSRSRRDLEKDMALNAHSVESFKGCFCCLGYGQWARECLSQIRCCHYYAYEHIERRYRKMLEAFNCFWRPKLGRVMAHKVSQAMETVNRDDASATTPLSSFVPSNSPSNRAEEQGVLLLSSRHNKPCSVSSSLYHIPPPKPVLQREISPTMANFPIDPAPFIPPTLEIEDGGNQRVPRAVVNLSGNVIHAHEEYVLIRKI